MGFIDKFKVLTYNVGIVDKPLDDVIEKGLLKGDIKWLKHRYKDRFFADPFLVKEDDSNYYIVCEELIFWENKGKISLLIVDKRDFSLIRKKTIIEEPWHLSFPYIIDGEYLLPESHKGGKAYIYHLNTSSWEIDNKELICDECGFVDPIIIKDITDNDLLLGTDNLSERLYIYTLGKDGKYHKKSKTTLLKDKARTRAAGDSFMYRGTLVRPVQDCVERYGRQTRIEKIIKLDSQTYEYEDLAVLNSDVNPPYDETFHTFNVYKKCIVVDGSKDIIKFPMKLFYRVANKFKK